MTGPQSLAELARPACFPHAPSSVQVVQTHLSVVLLADDLVYKLKKSITLPFVDFAPLANRRNACRDEVRLNRRLCPDTYLGTAALRRAADGTLHFAATGDDDGPADLDVAVVMRRLPQERMLDELLRQNAVTTAEIVALARQVAEFHARCERPTAALAATTPDQLAGFAADNFTALRDPRLAGLDPHLLDALASAGAADFARLLPDLRRRAANGRVVDGHGDLHARNVCLTAPATIYDCIEFAPAFRIGDVATEIAFLVMDLRYRHARDLAAGFTQAYVQASGDRDLLPLLPTLCGYRAMVRAKVAMLAAGEAELPAADRDGARASAARHLALAAAFAVEERGPTWVVLCGPPASGKSRLAAELAAIAQWPVLATDVLRKELAGLAPSTHARAEHYTAAFTERTYATLFARAAAATRSGERVVLLDGNFATTQLRAAAVRHAADAAVPLRFVHVHVDAATAVARAAQRAHDPLATSDAGPDVTAARHAQFVPPAAAEGFASTRLDGTLAAPTLAARSLAALLHTPR
ncbi:MAG: AAA family ATPase [Planctomycetes bacterium]|nr:AAA family ATPase [Planctomycetota bacterium]